MPLKDFLVMLVALMAQGTRFAKEPQVVVALDGEEVPFIVKDCEVSPFGNVIVNVVRTTQQQPATEVAHEQTCPAASL